MPHSAAISSSDGSASDPHLAVAGVGVELRGVPRCARGEVEGRVVAVVGRLEHQHGVRLPIGAQAGQVGERRMRPEAVVGVVGADLEPAGRDHQPLAGEHGADAVPPGDRRLRGRESRWELGRVRRPSLGDERLERVGERGSGGWAARAGSRSWVESCTLEWARARRTRTAGAPRTSRERLTLFGFRDDDKAEASGRGGSRVRTAARRSPPSRRWRSGCCRRSAGSAIPGTARCPGPGDRRGPTPRTGRACWRCWRWSCCADEVRTYHASRGDQRRRLLACAVRPGSAGRSVHRLTYGSVRPPHPRLAAGRLVGGPLLVGSPAVQPAARPAPCCGGGPGSLHPHPAPGPADPGRGRRLVRLGALASSASTSPTSGRTPSTATAGCSIPSWPPRCRRPPTWRCSSGAGPWRANPGTDDDDAVLFFTFGRRPPVERASLPRDTTLQRAILDRLTAVGTGSPARPDPVRRPVSTAPDETSEAHA